MELVFISGLSVLIQFVTVVMALRLIRVSGGHAAWILISSGIFLMALRRCITLYEMFSGEPPHLHDFPYELIGLFISMFMLAGIVYIAPIFRSIQAAGEERELMVARLQNALANVKTLSGLLPICASCKKIRDDKGYWNQIESYIREHTGTEFSHSICPECRVKLYGGITPKP